MTEIEAIAAWKIHPDTNRDVFEMLIDDCMADPEYVVIMKVLTVIWREEA